jgi:hypothetical protein
MASGSDQLGAGKVSNQLLMQTSSRPKLTLADLFYAPFGCLLEFPLIPLGMLLIMALLGAYLYFWVNIDLFGLGRPDYKNLQFNNTYTHVQADDGLNWAISYESPTESNYTGLVRFVSPIRESTVPFLTHDILMTTGDFASSDLVSTSVFDHHFSWSSSKLKAPAGTINLIHAVPMNESIYQQLLGIKSGQKAVIHGREILRIEGYQKTGEYLGKWEDTGCNSLLVTFVQIPKGQ